MSILSMARSEFLDEKSSEKIGIKDVLLSLQSLKQRDLLKK
jgi:hypothetical protein